MFLIAALAVQVSGAPDDFQVAASKTLKVDTDSHSFEYLYFTIGIESLFFEDVLTEVFYWVDYRDVGTSRTYHWVHYGDGHLLPSEGSWEGPFLGHRGIRYHFRFELAEGLDGQGEPKLKVTIFSTDPRGDAEFVSTFYEPPFDVTAYFYDLDMIGKALDTYGLLSTVYSGVQLARGVEPVTLVATAAVEFVVVLAIEEHFRSQPIDFDIRCNSCGHLWHVSRHGGSSFTFQCPDCGTSGKICFSR